MIKKVLPTLILGCFLYCTLIADETLKFPHERFFVDHHPKAKFKVLPNGMRYILMPNDNETGCFIGLYLSVGAMQEKENQKGVAHLVEHMAFNGTKNFSKASLEKFLRSNGLSINNDANAMTGYNRTFYFFDLSKTNTLTNDNTHSEAFKTCLSILKDIASGISLEEDVIEKEKGVILSEKRFRENLSMLLTSQFYSFALPELPFIQDMVIGSENTIKNFTKERCLEYYHQNYIPSNMVLIIAGNFHKKKIHQDISNTFGSLVNKKNEFIPPVAPKLNPQGIKINYVFDSDIPFVNLRIGTVQNITTPTKSFIQLNKTDLSEFAIKYIMYRRLMNILLQHDCIIHDFSFYSDTVANLVQVNTITANCEPENWKLALNMLNHEIQRILKEGFLESELKEFKQNYQSILESESKSDSSFSNREYAVSILNSLDENTPFLSIKQKTKHLEPLIITLNREDLLKEFKKGWAFDHRFIQVMGNVQLQDPQEEIKNSLQQKIETPNLKETNSQSIVFPYEKLPSKIGEIVKSESNYLLNFERYIFKNNVVINFFKSPKKDNKVYIKMNLGRGYLSLPEGKEAMSQLAKYLINFGGLEKMSEIELFNQLIGKYAEVKFLVDTNSFSFICETTNKDIETTLQVCREKLLHPGFRPEAKTVMKNSLSSKYALLHSDMNAHFENTLRKFLYNKDLRFHWPDRKVLDQVNFEDMNSWLKEQLEDCSIEVNVICNSNTERIKNMIGSYFGTLKERRKIEKPQLADFEIKQKFEVIETFPSKFDRAIICWIIPTTDFRNARELFKIDVLQAILQDRLRKLVRDKLALSYSPIVSHEVDGSFLNNGYLKFLVDVDSKSVDVIQKSFEEIINNIKENPFTIEEFRYAQSEITNHRGKRVSTINGIMKYLLEFSSEDKEKHKQFKEYFDAQDSVTYNDVLGCVKKYLDLEKKSVYILKADLEQTTK